MWLTIVIAEIVPIVKAVILHKNDTYYIEKLHAFPNVAWAIALALKQQIECYKLQARNMCTSLYI